MKTQYNIWVCQCWSYLTVKPAGVSPPLTKKYHFQASRVKKLRGPAQPELEKEETNKISHGPAYKKAALTDEEFARKKARYYKKLRLGHKGEHRPANTRHDQDDLSLQDLSAQQDKPTSIKHKKINFNKASSTYSS